MCLFACLYRRVIIFASCIYTRAINNNNNNNSNNNSNNNNNNTFFYLQVAKTSRPIGL